MFACCLSSEAVQNLKISRAQRKAESSNSRTISLLILGTGDSGKTTLRKQLLNVHSDQFSSPDYRSTFASIILGNLLDDTVEVLLAYEERKSEEISLLKEAARETTAELTPELRAMLVRLIWEDPSFMDLVRQSAHQTKIQLQDCFYVFAQELRDQPNWGLAGWVPSTEDCVRSRVRTSGVCSDTIKISGIPFVFYDVGGQRAERRKWLGSFETCTAAIFVTSISEYDQVLFEDRSKNRLEEALELFKECVNSPWLNKTTIILFLNKQDLFLRKFLVDKVPLNISGKFPSAPTANSTNEDAQLAVEWITAQFKAQKQADVTEAQGLLKPQIFAYVTTATDPANVKTVFNVCKDVVLKESLNAFGFA